MFDVNRFYRLKQEWEKEGKSLEYFSLLELVENHYFDYKAGYAKTHNRWFLFT